MGYLLAVFIGFVVGWNSAALFFPAHRLRVTPKGRQVNPNPGAEPVCKRCPLMGNV
jgi:hypothetical protein